MGPIGAQEMIFIFVLALLLFGPKKLPELGRLLGKGMKEFQKAKTELKSTFESHMQELERETKLSELKTSINETPKTPYSSAPYPYPYDEYGPNGSVNGSYNDSLQSAVSQSAPAEAAFVPAQVPVTGTVPRSNPVPHVEPAPVSGDENRPA